MKWGGLERNAGGSFGVGKPGVLNRSEGSFMIDIDAFEDDFDARRHAVGLPEGGRHDSQVKASTGTEGGVDIDPGKAPLNDCELALFASSIQVI